MNSLLRLTTLALLAALAGCPAPADDPFPRNEGDDDDGGDDDDATLPLAPDERMAWWDLTRSAPFGSDSAIYTSTASFFETPYVLSGPRPGGLGDCVLGSDPVYPFGVPASHDDFGTPSIVLDEETWVLERVGTALNWSRELPERAWQPFADADLAVGGGDDMDAIKWLGALAIPETLGGGDAALTEDGLELSWTAGVPDNRLRLLISALNEGVTDWIVCFVADSGSFTVPVTDVLEDFAGGDVTVRLRRETAQDTIELPDDLLGTAMGISELTASFTIDEDHWDDDGDDDDSSR